MPASRRRRAFGQHFLNDAKVIREIVDQTFACVEACDAAALLEVGPGRGAITRPLLEKFSGTALSRFLIVEKDDRLSDAWLEEGKKDERIEVLAADFLDVPAETYLKRTPLVVVSNLPYSAGTAILLELVRHREQIPSMVLMFQAEVAARLRAVPGDKAWGSLSLWIQNAWDVRKLCSVPPRSFNPPPDVNSEVVVLTARSTLRLPAPTPPELADPGEWDAKWNENWEKLIRIPFLHRRKMLRSGLPKNSIWKESFDHAELDGTRRAEDLDWSEWKKWMDSLQSLTFKFKNS